MQLIYPTPMRSGVPAEAILVRAGVVLWTQKCGPSIVCRPLANSCPGACKVTYQKSLTIWSSSTADGLPKSAVQHERAVAQSDADSALLRRFLP